LALLGQAKVEASAITAIGSHGHTVCHLPLDTPYASTLQLGETAVIAARTGCLVVGDFRPADIAQGKSSGRWVWYANVVFHNSGYGCPIGGQGAPLVPYADRCLHAHHPHPLILLNIGGIANLTLLHPSGTLAFDTGPGNMLIDRATQEHTLNVQMYDSAGCLAATGQCSSDLLDTLLQHPFYSKPAPKSAGREDFGEAYYHIVKQSATCSFLDLITTLTELTAQSIVKGIRLALTTMPCQDAGLADVPDPARSVVFSPVSELTVAVAGGGIHNAYLLQSITHILTTSSDMPNVNVCSYAGMPLVTTIIVMFVTFVMLV
jgi:anhydro-N-acetylmuramic acid kinase